MFNGQVLSVVVPAYNEQAHVGSVIETLPEYVDRAYVIDDCSTDDTWSVIQAYATEAADDRSRAVADGGAADRSVVPIRHEENRGVGGAIKTGYLAALRDGADVVAVMGGDGQMDPDLLAEVVRPVANGTAGYAKGNRLCSVSDTSSMPPFRTVGNRLLSWLTRLASGYWGIGDPQNGYTAISAAALEAGRIDRMYEFYGYCNDLLVKLNVADVRVADVPMPATYGDETSHINLATYVPRVSVMLFRNFWWRLRSYAGQGIWSIPTAYLLGIGGAVAGVFALSVTVATGTLGLLVVSLLAVACSIAVLATGVTLDRRHNADRSVRVET